MSIQLYNMIKYFINLFEKMRYKRRQVVYYQRLSFTQTLTKYPDPNKLYAYMHHHFHFFCPSIVRDHRQYFKQEQRGFGEDAFHAMWFLLLSEFKPKRLLEIGVYRGQVISLWALINHYLNYSSEIHGISPFSSLGDSVSDYIKNLDYMADVRNSFEFFRLPQPILIKSLSTDNRAIEHIKSYLWDLIYIDGSHDFETVLADYKLCRKNLSHNGILVLDDASFGTDYHPPSFSFAGHPGPSRVAREYADKEMRFLGCVGHNNIYQNI